MAPEPHSFLLVKHIFADHPLFHQTRLPKLARDLKVKSWRYRTVRSVNGRGLVWVDVLNTSHT